MTRFLLATVLGALLAAQLAEARDVGSGVELLGARQTAGVAPVGLASLVTGSPGFVGGELGLAFQFEPFPGRGIVTGPRLNLLAGSSSAGSRLALGVGLEGTLWLANVIGPGLVVDLVAFEKVAGVSTGAHFRFAPFLSMRVLRMGEEGALALRLALPYDTRHQWGFQAGVTFQLSGVPSLASTATP